MDPINVEIIDEIIEREGGFVHDLVDRGGATNFGVTARVLGEHRKLRRDATPEEVKALTRDEAFKILMFRYLEGPGFDTLPQNIRKLVVDMWVNHGPRNTTVMIQTALKLPCDGILGPKTLAAMKTDTAMENNVVYGAILAERIRFYGRIIRNDPSQSKFAAGWMDRAADFLHEN